MENLIQFLLQNINVIYLFIIPATYLIVEALKKTGKLGGGYTLITALGIGAILGLVLSCTGPITITNLIMGFIYGIIIGGGAVVFDNFAELFLKKGGK